MSKPDPLDGLCIPFNLIVDLTMHGDCHSKPDKDLHDSLTEVVKCAVAHGAASSDAAVAAELDKLLVKLDKLPALILAALRDGAADA